MRKLKTTMSVMLVLTMVMSVFAVFGITVSAATERTTIPWVDETTVQATTTDQTEFTVNLSSAYANPTEFTLWESTFNDNIAAATVTANGKVLTIKLDAPLTRDTGFFITATEEGKLESVRRDYFSIKCYRVADELQYSYGDNTDITYYEFYQDQSEYEVVLPTGTAPDAPLSIKINTVNDATVTYSGATALADGKATLKATVTAADNSLVCDYTVNFRTMSLEGAGTEGDPYKLSTAKDLTDLAACLNSSAASPVEVGTAGFGNYYGYYFELTDDIDLAGVEWHSIGHSGSTFFAGNFDGNGHVISNMTDNGTSNRDGMDSSYYTVGGLFGWSAFNTISNVTVKYANINSVSLNSIAYAGGITAVAYGCTVKNCAVYGSVIRAAREPVNTDAAGGIVGFSSDAVFESCASVGNEIYHTAYGGGFAGSEDGYSATSFKNCYVADCLIVAGEGVNSFTESGCFVGAVQFERYDLENCFVYNCKIEQVRGATGAIAGNEYGMVSAENSYFYSDEDYKQTISARKNGGYWQVSAGANYITTTVPSTAVKDTDWTCWAEIDTTTGEWVARVDYNGSVESYSLGIYAATKATAEEFSDGTILEALNTANGEEVFVKSDIHPFPVLASLDEYEVSGAQSGIVSIERISSEDGVDTYSIRYIPVGGVTVKTYLFTVENGKDGADGMDGTDGVQGAQGEKGEQGVQGIQGEKGEQGAQGIQGEKGEQGVQGEKGADGAASGNGLTVAALVIAAISLVGTAILAVLYVKETKKKSE